MLRRTRAAALLACCVLLVCGCAFITPTTEFSFNPATGQARFVDTKDNRVEMKALKVSKNGDGTFACDVDSLMVENQSSPVIRENIGQMLAFTEQQRAANEGMQIAFQGLTSVVRELVPLATVLRAGAYSPDQLDEWMLRLDRLRELAPPSTQPAPD